MINRVPKIVISLDFELRWGMHQLFGLDFNKYQESIIGERSVVPEMLKLIAGYQMPATWATVGAIAMTCWDEYFSTIISLPKYINPSLSIRREYSVVDPSGIQFFAPDLIQQICETPNQELGNHSFSHLFFCEPGVTQQDFLQDHSIIEKVFKEKYKVSPVSYIFPENQVRFVETFSQTSTKIWRIPPATWFHRLNSSEEKNIISRIFRIVDDINPFIRRAAHQPSTSETHASLFLRFNLPDELWRIQMKRVENEVARLSDLEVFHCWWHPHNLGFNRKIKLDRLKRFLEIIASAAVKHGVEICSMKDLWSNKRSVDNQNYN